MSANASKPKVASPVVVLREEPSNLERQLFLFVPSVIGSVVFHLVLLAAFFAYLFFSMPAQADVNLDKARDSVVEADQVELGKETFNVVDPDPAAVEPD